jgi:hypothetical protein
VLAAHADVRDGPKMWWFGLSRHSIFGMIPT